MGKSIEKTGSWLETFEKATKDTVLNGELRVPSKLSRTMLFMCNREECCYGL